MSAPFAKKGITRKTETGRFGDKISNGAKPMARVIRRAIGVDLTKCGGCAATQRGLNGGGILHGEPNQTVI